jgi:hypothetical protein
VKRKTKTAEKDNNDENQGGLFQPSVRKIISASQLHGRQFVLTPYYLIYYIK